MDHVIAVIGLGEVGRVLAEDLAPHGEVRAFDTAFGDPDSGAARNVRELGLDSTAPLGEVLAGADLVVCAVTAASTVGVAHAAADGVAAGAFYLDLNSSSPEHKRAAAAAIDAAGGRYVEVAVMSPIHPRRLAAPMLLGGPHAADCAKAVGPLGFSGFEVYADRVGVAAAAKLCRSVFVKGLEALALESMLTARRWGVEDDVLASLGAMFPGADWPELAAYLMSRALEHGARRAEEMTEAAAMVADAGVEPIMSAATARRQAWAAAFGTADADRTAAAIADRIHARLAELQ